MSEDYNNTLNLPETDFPMRGNLPQREPEMLDKWEQDRLYYALSEKNKGSPPIPCMTVLPMQTAISTWALQ